MERALYERGIRTFILDGGNVRIGLSSDLDFRAACCEENIRLIVKASH